MDARTNHLRITHSASRDLPRKTNRIRWFAFLGSSQRTRQANKPSPFIPAQPGRLPLKIPPTQTIAIRKAPASNRPDGKPKNLYKLLHHEALDFFLVARTFLNKHIRLPDNGRRRHFRRRSRASLLNAPLQVVEGLLHG